MDEKWNQNKYLNVSLWGLFLLFSFLSLFLGIGFAQVVTPPVLTCAGAGYSSTSSISVENAVNRTLNHITFKLPAVPGATACHALWDGVDQYKHFQHKLNDAYWQVPLESEMVCVDLSRNISRVDAIVKCGCGWDDVCPIGDTPWDKTKEIFFSDQTRTLYNDVCANFGIPQDGHTCYQLFMGIDNTYNVFRIRKDLATPYIDMLVTEVDDGVPLIRAERQLGGGGLPISESAIGTLGVINVEQNFGKLDFGLGLEDDMYLIVPVTAGSTDFSSMYIVNGKSLNKYGEFDPSKPCFVQHRKRYLDFQTNLDPIYSNLQFTEGGTTSLKLDEGACTDLTDDKKIKSKNFDFRFSFPTLKKHLTEQYELDQYFTSLKAYIRSGTSSGELQLHSKYEILEATTIYETDFTLHDTTTFKLDLLAMRNVTCSWKNHLLRTDCEICIGNGDLGSRTGIVSVWKNDESSDLYTPAVYTLMTSLVDTCVDVTIHHEEFEEYGSLITHDFCVRNLLTDDGDACLASLPIVITEDEGNWELDISSQVGNANYSVVPKYNRLGANLALDTDDDDDKNLTPIQYVYISLGILASLVTICSVIMYVIRKMRKNKKPKFTIPNKKSSYY